MIKKLYISIFIIISIMFIFSLNHTRIETIKHILKPLKLNESIIDNYFSDNIDKKSESIKQIKEIVLADLGYEDWMDYSEYMNILVFPNDINNNEEMDVIIALNLSKDSGIIAIYEKSENSYDLKDSIKELAYIEYLSILNYNNKTYLITEEIIDEKLGGYFYDESINVYYKDEIYKKVFQESKSYESYFYEGWKKEDIKNPLWYKLIENNIIDISPEKENLNIYVDKKLRVYKSEESSTSIPSNFIPIEERDLSIKYYWDDNYKYFIQQEGKLIDSGEIVGIISISEQNVDSYLNNNDIIYRIVDANGNIKYESSDKISVLE